MSAAIAVCKALQHVLCFMAYNAVYNGSTCAHTEQLEHVWTNYTSLVEQFLQKSEKWEYLLKYSIEEAVISAEANENDFNNLSASKISTHLKYITTYGNI